jgi:SNF2 family DNA or RNA helicase
MFTDSLSIIDVAKLNIAKNLAPLKQAVVFDFERHNYIISVPAIIDCNEFILKSPAIRSSPIINFKLTANSNNLLFFEPIEINSITNLNILAPSIFELISNENSILSNIEIHKINFQFTKPLIFGKNFLPKIEVVQTTLQLEYEDELDLNKTQIKPKAERHYSGKMSDYNFDIFDLIFPLLQPPLDNNFNSRLSLAGTLRAYQIEGVKFLYNSKNALLGDEMGLGKSIQTITAARFLFRKGEISSVCIICPLAVLSDWENKIWEWAPEFKVTKIVGNKLQRQLLWASPSHFYVCTYDVLRMDLENTSQSKGLVITETGHSIKCPNINCNQTINSPYSQHYKSQECPNCSSIFIYPDNEDIAKTNFDLLILDEVQKTKNSKSKITKSVRTIYSKYKWSLSGTPLENNINDLISICETTKPSIFLNIDTSNKNEIIEAFKPIFLRRKKDDVLKDLPNKVEDTIWLELSPSQRAKYDLEEKQGIIDLEGRGMTVSLHHALALITKLKQICNYDSVTNESVKLQYLLNDLEIVDSQGDKAIVFSQYPNETLKRILPYLEKYNAQIYDGSLSDSIRTKLVSDFQNNSSFKVMLISLKAGNAGITLTEASYVYHLDLWWNPAVLDQATARAHRFGQKKSVHEKYLLTNDTIEKKIYDLLLRKRTEFHDIIDGLNDTNVLTKSMSEDEIFGLFGLKKHR